MKPSLYLYHLVIIGIFFAVSFVLAGAQNALSVLIGGFVMLGNLFLLVWSWQRIFIKKSIALAVSVIVFKYAILGIIIYWLLSWEQIDVIMFLIGLTTLVPTLLLASLNPKLLKPKN